MYTRTYVPIGYCVYAQLYFQPLEGDLKYRSGDSSQWLIFRKAVVSYSIPNLAFVVDKDIGRFEVAVNDALTVHCIQSSEYLLVIPFGC